MNGLKRELCGLLVALGVSMVRAQSGTIALAEMQTLAQNGLEMSAIDTTYYVGLENLNDISSSSTLDYDSIRDEGGVFVIRPWEGRFRTERVNLATAFNEWGGPYVNFQQGRTQTGPEPYDVGSPLDPWGSPYLFFSPLGLLRGDNGQVTVEYYGDAFDRYTLVSLGPDLVQSSDDILYPFGPAVQSFALSSLRGAGVRLVSPPKVSPVYEVDAGAVVTLRGLNLGSAQGNATLKWNGIAVTEILSWSSREIQFVVPVGFSGVGSLTVDRISSMTNLLPLTIISPQSTVNEWVMY